MIAKQGAGEHGGNGDGLRHTEAAVSYTHLVALAILVVLFLLATRLFGKKIA